jgi:NAD(P)-dependent dehydrogenase (short-subunit alcohol dehydrogenase family)
MMAISTGRVTEPQEVADLAVFLASPRAANITGTEFLIDGGQIKSKEPSRRLGREGPSG